MSAKGLVEGEDRKSLVDRLGLAQTSHAITFFPLAAGLQDVDTFKTLENAALLERSCGAFLKTWMLRHDSLKLEFEKTADICVYSPAGKEKIGIFIRR